MFKRILKMVAIALASFVGAVGLGVGIYAIGGGFKDEKIDILKLYVANSAGNTDMNKEEIYTLSDVTRTIMCEPADATNKELEVIISDPLVASDEEYTGGILKNPPKTITAGEEFKLQINKDTNGNNIGGVVTVTIRPKGKAGITDVTLKVIVDTAIPEKSIYFSNNVNDSFTTSGKNIIMAQSANPQNIYLKSTLVNAFSLEVADKSTITNLKNVYFSYKYHLANSNEDPILGVINNATLEKVFDNNLQLYNYYYKVPMVFNNPGYVDITAKMHKTHSMEKDYIAGDFDNMIIPTNTSSEELKRQAQEKLNAYNAFLNKYKQFIDVTEASNNFFRNTLELIPGKDAPEIVLDYSEINESKKYIFQTTTFTVNITTVNLKKITSTSEPVTYKVLSTHRFTIDDLKTIYDLRPSVADDGGNEVDLSPEESKTLFDSLTVTPYVYVELKTYKDKPDLWNDYKNIIGVTSFSGNKPLTVPLNKTAIDGFDGIGILIKLEKENKNYDDYVTIKPSNDSSSKYWDISFNIPMINDEKSFNETLRALFFQFEVTGLDLNTLQPITARTFSRFFIEYTEYDFINDLDKITFTNPFSRMAINTNLNNTQGIYSGNKANEQNINLNLPDLISNYDSIEYKRVMYFVEKTSNSEDGYSKVLTLGKYKFKTMQGSEIKVVVENESGVNEEIPLIGERLLYTGSFDDPQYFIHAINASLNPVRVFAVVYLSDVNGNPIDLNGRKINIDEANIAEDSTEEDSTELVVFDITDITSNESVYIDSFMSNVNYYTYTKVDKTIEYVYKVDGVEKVVKYQAANGALIKRNHITTYSTEEGTFNSAKQEELIEFLKLKLLSNNLLDLYITNFELGAGGAKVDSEQIYIPIFAIKDFKGNILSEIAYNVNTLKNKQIAFNRFCEEYSLANYELEGFQDYKYEVVNDANEEPLYIQLRLRADKKIGDSIRIKANGSSVTNDLKDSDYVNWQVTNLEVEEVNLNLENYYKLYVRSSGKEDKLFDFVTTALNGDARSYTNYTLFEGKELLYEIITNVYKDGELNLSIVDASQAVFSAAGGEESEELYYYPDISTYIQKYCGDNTTLTYLTNDSAIMLKEDLVFKSRGIEDDNNEYIYVGSNKFPVMGNQVSINGKLYMLEGSRKSYQLVIPAGEYFPVVNNSENKKAIILGEEIQIEYVSNSGVYVVYNCNRQDNIRLNAIVEFKFQLDGINGNYSSHNYIYDGTKDASDTNSALIIGEHSATVNFKKGAVIEDIYESDINGFYKLVDGNYVVAEDSYRGDRYSKRGVKAFLMITFNGDVYENPITKVITYELIQEDITVTAYNKPENPGDPVTINSEYNPMKVKAGQDNIIQIASGGGNSINIESPLDRLNFFKHVKFSISGQGNVSFAPISFVDGVTTTIYSYDVNNPSLYNYDKYIGSGFTLRVPDTYINGGQFTVTLTYEWLDENNNISEQTKTIYFVIENNFDFTINEDVINGEMGENKETLGGINSPDNYTLKLEANKEYDIETTILKYFNVGENVQVSYEIIAGTNFATISGNSLSPSLYINNSYATYLNEKINLDTFSLRIKLTKDGKTIDVAKPIVISIIPDYVIDLNDISNSTQSAPITILNGECLYDYGYIKLYEYKNVSELGDLVADKSIYNSIFTITNNPSQGEDLVTFVNGVINNTSIINNYTETIRVSYTSLNENYSDTIGYIRIYGYTLNYAESGNGQFDGNASEGLESDYAIYIPSNGSVVMSDYYRVTSEGVVNGKHNLFMVLVDGEDNIYQTTNKEGVYTLYVANYIDGNYVLLAKWGKDNNVTIIKVNLFHSSEGRFGDGVDSSWSTLQGSNDYLLNSNLEITGNKNEVIDVSKYYAFYNNGGTPLTIVFRNANGDTESLVIGDTDSTYNVCYMANGVIYDSGYDVTLKVAVGA